MKLYYTVPIFNTPQYNASQSLGGYPSTNLLSPSSLGKLFSPVSLLNTTDKQYRCFAVYNPSETDVTIKVWLEQNADALFTYKVGFTIPDIDNCNRSCFETLTNGRTMPGSVNRFYDLKETDETEIVVAAKEYLGVWLEMTPNKKALKNLFDDCTKVKEIDEYSEMEDENPIKFIIEY